MIGGYNEGQCNVPHLATSKIGGILYRFMSVKRDIVDVDPPKAPQMFQATHQN